VDTRVKVITTLVLLIAVSLSHNIPILIGLYLFCLGLAMLSAVPLGFFIKRVWLLIPFFTGLIALPALFITPGATWLHLPWGLVVTQTGVQTALFLLLRVGTSVSLGILLILTSSWSSILKALGVLHIPDVFVLILEMTYRYIHLLLHTAEHMFLSRKSRILRPLTRAEEYHLLAANTGALLNKSLQLSGGVYLAMQSRGFRGYPHTLNPFKLQPVDWAYSLFIILVAAAAIWFGR
jgi:cobalt/nickel transport system permease protein